MADHILPPFPVDDATLDLLMAAIDPRGHGNETAVRSSLSELLELMSTLGGSDVGAAAEDDGSILVLKDPQYHDHDVITALVAEVRRLRADGDAHG